MSSSSLLSFSLFLSLSLSISDTRPLYFLSPGACIACSEQSDRCLARAKRKTGDRRAQVPRTGNCHPDAVWILWSTPGETYVGSMRSGSLRSYIAIACLLLFLADSSLLLHSLVHGFEEVNGTHSDLPFGRPTSQVWHPFPKFKPHDTLVTGARRIQSQARRDGAERKSGKVFPGFGARSATMHTRFTPSCNYSYPAVSTLIENGLSPSCIRHSFAARSRIS